MLRELEALGLGFRVMARFVRWFFNGAMAIRWNLDDGHGDDDDDGEGFDSSTVVTLSVEEPSVAARLRDSKNSKI